MSTSAEDHAANSRGGAQVATRSIEMSLVDAAGEVTQARVEVACRHWSEDGFHKTEVRLQAHWPGGEASGTGWNYHAALCRVREQLALVGLTPQCYGACRNLVLSNMCLDMALGKKGYLARHGQPTQWTDLVDIFQTGPDMDLVSVAEQAAFKQEWLRSLGFAKQEEVER